MMAGLLVNAGVGLLILFRLNRDRGSESENCGSTLWTWWYSGGIIIEFAGIVFLITESALSEEADFRRNDKNYGRKQLCDSKPQKNTWIFENSNDHTVTAADVDEYLKKHDSEVNIKPFTAIRQACSDGTVIKICCRERLPGCLSCRTDGDANVNSAPEV